MERNDQLEDWIFHYQHLNKVRRTKKQKQRFLATLVTDIAKLREDIQVIEYQQKKQYISSNVYVGNIETADRIICTYYDTPLRSFGSYQLFDRTKQRQATIRFIVVSLFLFLLLGLVATVFYMNRMTGMFHLGKPSTWAAILCYGLYFFLFSKLAKGLSNRKNTIRNTSSILALLMLIASHKNSKTAFAFLDEGCFGDQGLNLLKETCRSAAQIYYLDCVGSQEELHFISQRITEKAAQSFIIHQDSDSKISYIFGAKVSETEQGERYFLEKATLNQKEIDRNKLKQIKDFFTN
ncbi:hypothetical protein GCM10011573_19920 [Enterococcus wangshanyuanii]|uniref:Uncharacterized protein n=2 Tax=Enterococcus wangshanyuanii TaxID=2005703 RepID=A0ABQ1P3Z7_9ENTE|nr:hypothetical protein GCM10011573_19920 [Enterococcus wangshanyuanii]